MKLVLPGRSSAPVVVAGALDVDREPIFQSWIVLKRPVLKALRANRRAARFRTRVRAVDVITGEVDVDRRTFRFKTG